MNPELETHIPTQQPAAVPPKGQEPEAPSNWLDALLVLMASRVTLMNLESKDAARNAGRRAVLLFCLASCLFFTWALVLAGGIAAIAELTGYAWYWIAMIIALVHLIAASMLGSAARKPGAPAFPVTRAEFEKDRIWIKKLQQTQKSND